ncbi:MAG: glutamate synthase subunit alpha, partial [Cyanobacteria bacterium P01_F01_bin.53]
SGSHNPCEPLPTNKKRRFQGALRCFSLCLLVARNDVSLAKTKALDLSALVKLPDVKSDRTWLNHGDIHTNGPVLDDEILADADVASAIATQGTVAKTYDVVTIDRTVGARISGVIAQKYGNEGFTGQLDLTFKGSVGQSFGAFNIQGKTMTLIGEANDYVGKGMNGGEIIIKPFEKATYEASQNVIAGNTCLYGASGGTLFANGIAGERFAVRNSKGKAVIEGAGDHCCEYMTGGVVVVLGSVGRNVGAGMTGGLGYFLDEAGDFQTRVNPEIVQVQKVLTDAGSQQLKSLIETHADRTGSAKAKAILADWDSYLPKFWQVVPPSEADSAEAGVQKDMATSSVS